MVVPALSTLLSHAPRKTVSDAGPAAGTQFSHKLKDFCVLFLGPGSLYNLVLGARGSLKQIFNQLCTYILTRRFFRFLTSNGDVLLTVTFIRAFGPLLSFFNNERGLNYGGASTALTLRLSP